MKHILSNIRYSLKFRVILFTLAIFMVGVTLVSVYLSHMLRKDMQQLLGDQQVATVAQAAAEINTNFKLRIHALELVSGGIDPSMMDQPAVLQAYLEQRPLLEALFNTGILVVRINGDAVAEVPLVGRVGTNYMDRDYVITSLKEGKATVGKAIIGRKTGVPVFAMAVPIKDPQGRVIGALTGSTDLSKPNFLNGLMANRYGQTGGFLIVDPKNNLFVTGTSSGIYEKLLMQPLPSREVNPLTHRRIEDGFDGTAVNVNSIGVEVMTSSARLPFPGWMVIASLPTAEAFAPIAQAQIRILVATVLVSLIAAGLIWLFMTRMLRLQFEPMLIAAKKLDLLADTDAAPQLLPVANHDEVGLLFESFNRLLGTLSTREKHLRMMFEQATDGIHILDMQGNLLQCSQSFAAMLGYTTAELKNLNVRDWDVQFSPTQMNAAYADLVTTSKIFDTKSRRKDGTIINVQVHAKMVQIDGKDCVYCSGRDITQQRLDRAQLDLLAACMIHTNDVVIITQAEPITLPGPRIVYVNDAFIKMTGYTREEAIGNTPRMLQGPKSDLVVMQGIHDALKKWESVRVEMINYAKDGREFWVELDITPIADSSGWYTHWISIQRDITERKTADNRIRKLSLAVEQSLESVVVTDLQGTIEYVNKTFVRNTGYCLEEAIGKNPRMLQSGKTPAETYRSLWTALRRGQPWKGEFINRRKDGSEYTAQSSISPICDDAGKVAHYVASQEDVTKKRATELRILHLAYFDDLTNLPNRRLLIDRLQAALAACAQGGHFGALFYIDLDNFKTVNDTLGHDLGDQLLQQVAARLSEAVTPADTVATAGGDDFFILLPDLGTDIQQAETLLKALGDWLLASFQTPFLVGHTQCRTSPSIGVTLFGHPQDTVEELLKHVDLAMYEAKGAGRNTLRFFDAQVQAAVVAEAALEADLRMALERGEFRLHYQIQVDEASTPIGAEALVRWQHPQRGLLAPGAFIGTAEKTGLIVPMGAWVLEAACAQLAVWATQPEIRTFTLAVNVSAKQFRQPDFVDQCLDIFARTGVDPNRLKLEPTESLLHEDVEDTIAKMTTLRAHGVRFALDDFGTGYSSLTYLRRLPLDQLKIDQSFVQDIPDEPNACVIVRTIIVLGQSLGLAVIAEGVETEEQRRFLADNGCRLYQGYFFGRPVAIDAFEASVKRGHD